MNYEVKSILVALNSNNDMGFKYPIGNKELTIVVRELERDGIIKYCPIHSLWSNKRSYKCTCKS